MMKTKNNICQFILFFTIVIVSIFSCKEETYNNLITFEFSASLNQNNQLTLDWTETNVSTFEQYLIAFSVDSIPSNFQPNFSSSTVSIFQTIDNQRINSIDTIFIPFNDKYYFQAFIKSGNKLQKSNQVQLDIQSFHKLENRINQVFPNVKDHSIIMYNENVNELITYDYLNYEKISSTIYTQDLIAGEVGHINGESELYIIHNDTRIKIYDANSLIEKANINPDGGDIYNLTSNNNGIIAFTIDNNTMPVQFYNRATESLLNGIPFNINNSVPGITFLSDSVNEGIIIGQSGVDYFVVDNEGQLLEYNSLINNLGIIDFTLLKVSSSENYFITSREGLIFDKDLNYLARLYSNPAYTYIDYAFSENETKLFALSKESSNDYRLIEYRFPELTIKNEIFLTYEPLNMFIDDAKLYLIGRNFSNFKTIIQNFPL